MEARKTMLPPEFWAIICLRQVLALLLVVSDREDSGEGRRGLTEQQLARRERSQSC